MATRLKIVDQLGADLDAPKVPSFTPAPTRKQHAGWTAERQRAFIARLAQTGSVGEACAIVGVASTSVCRLRNKAGGGFRARLGRGLVARRDAASVIAPAILESAGNHPVSA